MPKLVPIERDYTQIIDKFNTVGPLVEKAGMPLKGVPLSAAGNGMEYLAHKNGVAPSGPQAGRPLVDTAVKQPRWYLPFRAPLTAPSPLTAGASCLNVPALSLGTYPRALRTVTLPTLTLSSSPVGNHLPGVVRFGAWRTTLQRLRG